MHAIGLWEEAGVNQREPTQANSEHATFYLGVPTCSGLSNEHYAHQKIKNFQLIHFSFNIRCLAEVALWWLLLIFQ